MGRYRSDDSDSEHSRRSKKKKKRRGRSRSSSDSESSHVSSSRSKKSKKKHRKFSRSRSRSVDRKRGAESRSSRRTRSRSGSAERYNRRKPGSSSRRSRSPPPLRRKSRSRSPSSRRRRSRSYSREQRSRSGSAPRFHKRRSRSLSRDGRSKSADKQRLGRLSLCEQIPGYSQMSPAEQAEERMRLALKAAAAADEKLKGQGGLRDTTMTITNSPTVGGVSDSSRFADSVAAIESNSFVQSSFKSSRSTKVQEEPQEAMPTHDDAIFGSLAVTGFTMTPDPDIKPVQLDPDSIIHPSLYCDPEDKMDRWIQRLIQLRRRKLEGEAM